MLLVDQTLPLVVQFPAHLAVFLLSCLGCLSCNDCSGAHPEDSLWFLI